MTTTRPLSPAMQKTLVKLLTGPLRRARDPHNGDGWIAQDKSFHALIVVRRLYERGLVMQPARLAVLSIAGRQEAQRIGPEHTTESRQSIGERE